MLPIGEALRQALVPALRQQEDADDADERAAGKDDVVQEVAFLVVQLDDGCRQHAEACTSQHQPQPAAPAGGPSTNVSVQGHPHAWHSGSQSADMAESQQIPRPSWGMGTRHAPHMFTPHVGYPKPPSSGPPDEFT